VEQDDDPRPCPRLSGGQHGGCHPSSLGLHHHPQRSDPACPTNTPQSPAFHRWNGRVYMVSAFSVSLAGLYMMWFRGTVGGFSQHLAQSLDAVLIMLFAVIALRYAMARDFKAHRRWALRLYLVVSASLFIRAAGIILAIAPLRGLSASIRLRFGGRCSLSWRSPSIWCPWPSLNSISGHSSGRALRAASRWPCSSSC